jgi:hypothetical protein
MMKSDHAEKPTPEMIELAAAFKGTVQKIPTGKRITRGPSKKPGESGSLRGHWTEEQDRQTWGDQ